jgi:hypothetical protein
MVGTKKTALNEAIHLAIRNMSEEFFVIWE